MGRKLAYLAEYIDQNGIHHTAVHFYDRMTGIVDMMRDVKFDDGNYPLIDAELFQQELAEAEWRKAHPRFEMKAGRSNGHDCFNVHDNDNECLVAIFFNEDDAVEYTAMLNENATYLLSVKDLDVEDPFI